VPLSMLIASRDYTAAQHDIGAAKEKTATS